MKVTIVALGACGLLIAAPAVAQMGNSMSNGSTKAPMNQSMSGRSGAMSCSGENKTAMKHGTHHKKHHRMHRASKMSAKTGM